jgi:flagellar basal-body rod protein FlgB
MEAVDKILSKALDTIWAKHEAIAGNIANSDTPGYVRQDIDFQAQVDELLRNEGEIQDWTAPQPQAQPGVPIKLENETAELSENTELYDSVARITALRMQILNASLGSGT